MKGRLRGEHKALSHKLLRTAYRGIRGIELSRDARKSGGTELTYGEVVSTSFEQLLMESTALVKTSTPPGQRCFVDLGSGTGKAVLTASLFADSLGLSRSIGIELLEPLHQSAEGASSLLSQNLDNLSISPPPPPPTSSTAVLARIERIISAMPGAPGYIGEAELAARLLNYNPKSDRDKDAKAAKQFASRFSSFRKFLQVQADLGLLRLRPKTAEDSSLLVSLPLPAAPAAVSAEEDEGGGEGEDAGGAMLSAVLASASADALALLRRRPRPELFCGSFLPSPGQEGFVSVRPVFAGEAEAETGAEAKPEVAWWEVADVAFAASLLFPPEMMLRLAEQVASMRPGSVFLSLKPLPEVESRGLESRGTRARLIGESFFQMSWQKALVYTYRLEVGKEGA